MGKEDKNRRKLMINLFKSRPGRKIIQRPAGKSGPVERIMPSGQNDTEQKEMGMQ